MNALLNFPRIEEPYYTPLEHIAVILHKAYPDHRDATSRECEKCIEVAQRVMEAVILEITNMMNGEDA